MAFPTLHTPRLVLRPFEMSDASAVQRLAGAPEVALTTKNIPYPYEDGMAEAWIASHGPAWEEGKSLTLAVTAGREKVIGAVGLHLTAIHSRGEIGYWVGLPFWNRGYATEASGAILQYGFDELALNRIQARHMTRNPSSGRVLDKLGMKLEGVHRQYVRVRETYEDVAMYAMLNSDRADRE